VFIIRYTLAFFPWRTNLPGCSAVGTFVFVSLCASVDAGEAVCAVAPGFGAGGGSGAVDAFAREMAVDRGGGGGFEFEGFGRGALVGPGFADDEAFGFEGFDAVGVGIGVVGDAKVVAWVCLLDWFELGGEGSYPQCLAPCRLGLVRLRVGDCRLWRRLVLL
jgi:hypothetical protein